MCDNATDTEEQQNPPERERIDRSLMAATYDMESRPAWPRRAIVTAGEPYGNKGLHFGHVGGVFVPADFFARFLRDRLGREIVIFTSGTDWYGSPFMESFRKLRENEGYD